MFFVFFLLIICIIFYVFIYLGAYYVDLQKNILPAGKLPLFITVGFIYLILADVLCFLVFLQKLFVWYS